MQINELTRGESGRRQASSWVPALAGLTRRWHPKGTDRLVRALHPPGTERPVRTIIDYDQGLRIHIDTHSFCEWYIYFYGAFRPRISAKLNAILKPGDTAIDVGANIGMHTLIMAHRVGRAGRVVSFEPDPHPLDRMKQNLALNGLDFVEARAMALSDKSERRTFFLHDETIGNYANASLHARNVGRDTPSIEVEVVSLDDFVKANAIVRLDAIKLLAQGEEWNVMRGGAETLARFKPKLFFLYEPEYWHRHGVSLADARGFLGRFGYTIYELEFAPERPVTGESDKGQVLYATT
jgi:FkbM family methyltransferase